MQVEEALDILAARLSSIPDLTVTTNPRAIITVPMAVVDDGEVDFNESFKPGACLLAFTVTVYVSAADSVSGHMEARGYLSAHGATSVRAALEDARDDDLDRKVKLDSGNRDADANYITAVFSGRTHVPAD